MSNNKKMSNILYILIKQFVTVVPANEAFHWKKKGFFFYILKSLCNMIH